MNAKIETLEQIIGIARQQRRLVIYEDVTPVFDLQQKREALLEGILPADLDLEGEYEKGLAHQIIKLDREIIALLAARLDDTKNKIQELSHFKKMLQSRRKSTPEPSNKLSCRI